MKIKWESNTRTKHLAAQGKIKQEDVIKRTQTINFPADTCTIRMAKPNDPKPYVTLHIRGKSKKRTYAWTKDVYECAETCRVNIGGVHTDAMCSNGMLDEDLSWQDVHNLVEKVKKVMDF